MHATCLAAVALSAILSRAHHSEPRALSKRIPALFRILLDIKKDQAHCGAVDEAALVSVALYPL